MDNNERKNYKKAVQIAFLNLAKQVWDSNFIADAVAFQLLVNGHIKMYEFHDYVNKMKENDQLIELARRAVLKKLLSWKEASGLCLEKSDQKEGEYLEDV